MTGTPEERQQMRQPEIWGGIECTLNRVADRYSDQCAMSGHDDRVLADLARFASLGIRKLRYPVLWEKVAPRAPDELDFSRSELALLELRELGIDPIVGLVHHGSGPRYASLLDETFPEKLATYAYEVARRFPWVGHVTPINEPLTTARFTGLYGTWYPHARDEMSWGRALYNEIKGTILAMRKIREINPNAKLVQTDDLGRMGSTPGLQYQVDFENERRWLGWDLLFGRVDRGHLFFSFLRDVCRITEEEILWFVDNPCPPDIIGVNHYPLSNRFLDHRLDLYPSTFHGGNGRERYADIGAVDTGQTTSPPPLEIFRDVWERYHRPFAVTEAHTTGPRETQLRWLKEIWDAARQIVNEGADLRAVTVWSLLGAYDWSTLCTAEPCRQTYESGVFDLRGPKPRATALASQMRLYGRGLEFDHPVLDRPGYWREPHRAFFAKPQTPPPPRMQRARPILIAGGDEALDRAFARICDIRGIEFVLLSGDQLDITSLEEVRGAIAEFKPWAVVNATGFVSVDDAEKDPERCRRENTHGPRVLAHACAEADTRLLTFSTDHVFDGSRREPYRESHATRPLNIYGRTKAAAEAIVTGLHERSLVIRTSAFFGPWDESNFAIQTLKRLRAGETIRVSADHVISPTYIPDLVGCCLDLLIDGERGIVHLSSGGEITWADWARLCARLSGADHSLIVDGTSCELLAPRPPYSALASERVPGLMPDFEKAMHVFMNELSSTKELT